MELLHFLKVLIRHKLILVIVPLATVIITYFLVNHMPDQYISQTRIATGIVDNTDEMPGSKMLFQDMRANQEFDNIIQTMMLKKIVNQVSYKLIIHDLTLDTSFRKKSSIIKDLNRTALNHAIATYTNKYRNMEDLSLWNTDERGLYEVLKSMKYDYASLTKNLRIYRVGNSDYISVEYESENPILSAYIVNTLTQEFTQYYGVLIQASHVKAINYLDSMLRYKQEVMNGRMEDLKNYKIQNRVLNLNEQAKSLYSQIADFETKREMAKKDVDAYGAAIRNIDSKFDPADRRYMESAVTEINQQIETTKELLKDLNQAYITHNFDPSYKPQMDAAQKKLYTQINEASDKHAYSPMVAKENLVGQKLSLETTRELAENSLSVINAELVRLNKKQDALVPNEAEIQAYEQDIDIVSREYIELLTKYNQASMESGNSIHLRQMDVAMPGTALPSKKMILVVLSGIISFVFCVVVLFVLFMLDRSINTPKELANESGLPVLGYLNKFDNNDILDFGKLWGKDIDATKQTFKDLLRSIRFELENDITPQQKVIAITSLLPGEGKTFLTVSLAYAFTHINKKVLIIDGNFLHPSISNTVQGSQKLETLFAQGKNNVATTNAMLDVVANSGGDVSLLELANHEKIEQTLNDLKTQYDLILIETSALHTRNVAKEWLEFADKIVGIYEAGRSINAGTREDIEYLKGLDNKFSGWVLNKMVYGTGVKKLKLPKYKEITS
jgi:polysaccharide biosynthesis transport protein